MLESLRLKDFRGFDDHIVRFRKTTVIVGANNAGKSTIVEAIRLVSLVANRHGNLNFSRAPEWLDAPAAGAGVRPSLRDLNTNLSTVVNVAGGSVAEVVATFTEGEVVHLYVGRDDAVFAAVWGRRGRLISSKTQANRQPLPRVAVQPPVAPLQLHEKLLDDRTVRRGMDSPLASQHFRNQLRLLGPEDFLRFKVLSEETWPTLQIQEVVGGREGEVDELSLLVRDRAFVGEVGNMGHGLQMWLQTMWFLARNMEAPTVVLDEPDVYMHPDLQRRLMRRLRRSHSQVIVATHSVEIMAEASPADVLVIDADLVESPWAVGVAGLQRAINAMGGIHNLDLARLVSARRFLMIEGDDIDILRRPFDRLYPDDDALDILPSQSVGGWSGWQRAIGASSALTNASGDAISSFCIFDSDFHHVGDITKRYKQAEAIGIRLHIWARKELENYLIDPDAVHRLVVARSSAGSSPPTAAQVQDQIEHLADAMKDELVDQYGETYRLVHRAASIPKAAAWARAYLRAKLDGGDPLWHLVGGKALISSLSTWATDACGASFAPGDLAMELRASEIPIEMQQVLGSIRDDTEFPALYAQRWQAFPDRFSLES